MDFNSDYWVPVGATAPVIALSCILLINDVSELAANKHMHDSRVTLYASRIPALRAVTYAFWINGINLALQGAMIYAALDSLRMRRDYWPEEIVAFIETAAILLLLFATGSIVASKAGIRIYENKHPVPGNLPASTSHNPRRKVRSNGYTYSYPARRLATKPGQNGTRGR